MQQSSMFQVKQNQNIPQHVWEEFVNEFPWCRPPQLLDQPYKTMLGLLILEWLHSSITWNTFEKLHKICGRFLELSNDKTNQQVFVCKFFQTQHKRLSEITSRVDVKITQYPKSSQEKQRFIRDHVESRRAFVESLRSDLESLSLIARGIALSVYLQNDFYTLSPLQQLVKSFPRERIIQSLMKGECLNQNQKDVFFLDDQTLIPISYTLQLPIYYYNNVYDSAGRKLQRRRVHALQEEQALAFFIDNGCIRALLKHNPQIILNILREEQIKQTNERSKYEVGEMFTDSIASILQQLTIECTQVSENWMTKLIDLIQQGDTNQLLSKKVQVKFDDPLNQKLRNLIVAFNDPTSLQIVTNLQYMLEKQIQYFEKLFIAQASLLRDNLIQYSQNLQGNSQRSNHIKEALPPRPKILQKEPKQSQKGQIHEQHIQPINQSFVRQKNLTNHSRIEAKLTDQDLPDPIENLTEVEIDTASIFKDDEVVSLIQPVTQQVQTLEYHTSDDEKLDTPEKVIPDPSMEFDYGVFLEDEEEREKPLQPPKLQHKPSPKPTLSKKTSFKAFSNLEAIPAHNYMSEENDTKTVYVASKGRPPKNSRVSFEQHHALNIKTSMITSLKMNTPEEDYFSLQRCSSVRGSDIEKLPFYPNNSRKSTNVKNKFLNSIREDTEPQSTILSFECPICFDQINNYQDIKTVHDGHRFCLNCLESWIKVKYNAGQWNFEKFNCPIQTEGKSCDHAIDQELIKQVLSEEEFQRLCERAYAQARCLDIECPHTNCGAQITGIPPKNADGFKCPDCNQQICWVCKGQYHDGRICPQRLEEIKGALQDERIGCCPECLEIFMKNDGCQHVTCYKCEIDFCFACSAPRDPIMGHGAHYHRVGCEYYTPWIHPDSGLEILENEFDPDCCDICKKTQKECIRPITLDDFKKLAHI